MASGAGEGGRRVRIARIEHAGAVAEIYAPYVRDTVISFEYDAPGEAEIAGRMAKVQTRLPWLILEEDARLMGYAYASPHRERAAYQWSVDVGIYVRQGAQRSGIGRALYARLLAALTAQGYHRAYGAITLPNAASVGLHEACGFRHIGSYPEVGFKFGAWHGVGWWGLDLGTSFAPEPPIPFSPAIFARAEEGLRCD